MSQQGPPHWGRRETNNGFPFAGFVAIGEKKSNVNVVSFDNRSSNSSARPGWCLRQVQSQLPCKMRRKNRVVGRGVNASVDGRTMDCRKNMHRKNGAVTNRRTPHAGTGLTDSERHVGEFHAALSSAWLNDSSSSGIPSMTHSAGSYPALRSNSSNCSGSVELAAIRLPSGLNATQWPACFASSLAGNAARFARNTRMNSMYLGISTGIG
jgi:hypothetical protein